MLQVITHRHVQFSSLFAKSNPGLQMICLAKSYLVLLHAKQRRQTPVQYFYATLDSREADADRIKWLK